MDIDIKIYLREGSNEPFFGKGPSALLKKINESGSIRKAAHKINIKKWKMI